MWSPSLTRALTHPDISEFQNYLGATKACAEMEGIIQKAVGKSGLMEGPARTHR
jgi:hypothetical protein